MSDETSERIVQAAMDEFAQEGFGGARVAQIAEKAGVNKALLFYYYRSKEKLYAAVLERVMKKVLDPVLDFLETVDTPEAFLEGFPRIHIRFIAQNQHLMRIGIGHFISRPRGVGHEALAVLKNQIGQIRQPLLEKVTLWIKEGKIRAEDPIHFIINVISLNAFCFLARPFFESITGICIDDDPDFVEKRIRSVVATLKGGMLA